MDGSANKALATRLGDTSCKACPVHSRTLAMLRESFGPQIMLGIDDVATVTGVAAKTIRNKIPSEWPIPAQFIQGRWKMHVAALAEAIDTGALDFYRRRRRGRPRKSEQASPREASDAHSTKPTTLA